ncbi:MAG TPA: hypothetical protein VJ302_17425 [Blastocatellia bacterium]|nr:hypothetical protein [Blastocatellia bacterium]
MTIQQMIEAKRDELLKNPELGHAFREKAIKAIHAGIGTAAWNEYMAQFASTPAQLARLQSTDTDGDDPYIPRARAYLVANAVCTPGTISNLPFGIDDKLDVNLT